MCVELQVAVSAGGDGEAPSPASLLGDKDLEVPLCCYGGSKQVLPGLLCSPELYLRKGEGILGLTLNSVLVGWLERPPGLAKGHNHHQEEERPFLSGSCLHKSSSKEMPRGCSPSGPTATAIQCVQEPVPASSLFEEGGKQALLCHRQPLVSTALTEHSITGIHTGRCQP